MIDSFLRGSWFGCGHRTTTFPQTSNDRAGRTYVVCLDCGTEFEYDWSKMRRGAAVRVRQTSPASLVGSAVLPTATFQAGTVTKV